MVWNQHRSVSVAADGAWTYTLDNASDAVQNLPAGSTLADTFTVQSADKTTQVVAITIRGTNDAPTLAAPDFVAVDQGLTAGFPAAGADRDAGDTPTYSLAPGAPTRAAIDPTTGVFT